MLGLAFAMGTPPGGASGGGQSALLNIVPLIFMFGIFYFLLIRPQQKRAKEHRSLLSNLKEGDQVITSGGIYGRITGIRDDRVTLEISDKVRVKVNRGNIAGVVKGDA